MTRVITFDAVLQIFLLKIRIPWGLNINALEVYFHPYSSSDLQIDDMQLHWNYQDGGNRINCGNQQIFHKTCLSFMPILCQCSPRPKSVFLISKFSRYRNL